MDPFDQNIQLSPRYNGIPHRFDSLIENKLGVDDKQAEVISSSQTQKLSSAFLLEFAALLCRAVEGGLKRAEDMMQFSIAVFTAIQLTGFLNYQIHSKIQGYRMLSASLEFTECTLGQVYWHNESIEATVFAPVTQNITNLSPFSMELLPTSIQQLLDEILLFNMNTLTYASLTGWLLVHSISRPLRRYLLTKEDELLLRMTKRKNTSRENTQIDLSHRKEQHPETIYSFLSFLSEYLDPLLPGTLIGLILTLIEGVEKLGPFAVQYDGGADYQSHNPILNITFDSAENPLSGEFNFSSSEALIPFSVLMSLFTIALLIYAAQKACLFKQDIIRHEVNAISKKKENKTSLFSYADHPFFHYSPPHRFYTQNEYFFSDDIPANPSFSLLNMNAKEFTFCLAAVLCRSVESGLSQIETLIECVLSIMSGAYLSGFFETSLQTKMQGFRKLGGILSSCDYRADQIIGEQSSPYTMALAPQNIGNIFNSLISPNMTTLTIGAAIGWFLRNTVLKQAHHTLLKKQEKFIFKMIAAQHKRLSHRIAPLTDLSLEHMNDVTIYIKISEALEFFRPSLSTAQYALFLIGLQAVSSAPPYPALYDNGADMDIYQPGPGEGTAIVFYLLMNDNTAPSLMGEFILSGGKSLVSLSALFGLLAFGISIHVLNAILHFKHDAKKTEDRILSKDKGSQHSERSSSQSGCIQSIHYTLGSTALALRKLHTHDSKENRNDSSLESSSHDLSQIVIEMSEEPKSSTNIASINPHAHLSSPEGIIPPRV